MLSTARSHGVFRRHRLRSLGGVIAAGALAGIAVVPGAAAAAPRTTGSAVGMLHGPYGPMLIAGSGPFAGTALYSITSDYGKHIGCTPKVVTLSGPHHSKLSCTGTISSNTAEWPAYLTSAAPVAGPGVTQSKLGEVKVKGLGEQVTYNGHPLYLFDSLPGLPTGENWDEPSLPPWHGNWYLLTPAGAFLPRTALFGTVKLDGKFVLAAYMEDGGGTALFPVYSFSGSSCTGVCAADFPPVISQGHAGTTDGVPPGKLALVARSDGTEQVTFAGTPLYFDANEGLTIGANGVAAEGSGNGAKAPAPTTGTFSFVTP